MVERRYYLTDEHYQSGICDEVIEPRRSSSRKRWKAWKWR